MSDDSPAESAVMRKAAWKLIPFLFFLYVIAYLDRVNVGFAKLHMKELPWFNDAVFGTGAGIFFLGYFIFEVPSNLILQRVGARRWIARIMFTWGVISALMALSSSATSFYFLRFLLGVAEAGFFPGVLLYLTFWFTAKERARVVALFMTANAVALSFGNPLSGAILDLTKGMGGLGGWQWLFIFEAIPAILMTFVVLYYLPDGPTKAVWLSDKEKSLIAGRLEREARGVKELSVHGIEQLKAVATQPKTWLCCAVFFLLVFGMYGITMWLPQFIDTLLTALGYKSKTLTGLFTAIPYFTAGFVMVANAWHSDKTGERRLHIAIPAMLGALGLALSGLPGLPMAVVMLCLALAASGMWSILGPFWAIPPQFLARGTLAAGIALINSVGNLAGYAGPKLFGTVKSGSDSFLPSLLLLAGVALTGGFLALALPRPSTDNTSAETSA